MDGTAMRRRRQAGALGVLLLLAGCTSGARPFKALPPPAPRLSVPTIGDAIPSRVKDRRAWAEAVVAALEAIDKTPAREPVCAVLAIIEQESGYVANPEVANLPHIVDAKLEAMGHKLGPLGRPALNRLLDGRAPRSKYTFAERLEKVRTERDVDIVFRDLVTYYRDRYPKTAATAEIVGALAGTDIDDLNPITTAGSMQVSVRFAATTGAARGMTREQVRDALYTLRGGVLFGTARLFADEANYDDFVYRFADYNAGIYASRNAALQAQVGNLVGTDLVLDGDLLAYEKSGEVIDADTKSLAALLAFRSTFAPELSERQVRKEARLEKTRDFEASETYRAIKRAFENHFGKAPEYARLPEVAIKSAKLSRELSTAWFAQSVNRRFRNCLQRIGRR
jgi:hypothetical protein